MLILPVHLLRFASASHHARSGHHPIRRAACGVQALARPHFLSPWRRGGERADAACGAYCVHGRGVDAPPEPGREARAAGELGLGAAMLGRDD